MAAFKQHCSFGFWKGKLLLPPDDKAEQAMGQFGRISSLSDLPPDAELIDLVRRAVQLNQSGTKVASPVRPKRRQELVVPDYLTSALRRHKGAVTAFESLSYSHKKEYVEWLTEAKGDDTRRRRLETAVQWILEGKSRHWKYADCKT